ncbi:hypothetical protein L1049_022169 [Liquidambar formosana]|uniref:Syntaxin 6/10/61 N-terminal domain-containing protein n=1 Tax=Liquidambar formosana TaxID=63359 RepID=A0AAP0WNT8_LIQFO
MLVANSFDLWRKDVFFSAAEEVQESADIMESAYRSWVRERREGLTPEDLDELRRELQTALGTAKWQLEEFDRAVRLSHGSRSNDNSTTRHKQFVAAIENQISRVEAALMESFNEEGKQPLRWVNLNQEECDDLAMFLSGTSGTSQAPKDECMELGPSKKSSLRESPYKRKDVDLSPDTSCNIDIPDEANGFKDVVTINKDAKFVIELEAKEILERSDDINCQADRATGSRRTWSSPNIGAWKIVIADEDEQRKTLKSDIEATPKEKGSKPVFWKQKCGEHPKEKGGIPYFIHLRGINWINQVSFMDFSNIN